MQKHFPKEAPESADEIVFSLDAETQDASEPHEPITFWIPTKYKAKYDLIQSRSRRRFGKHLKKVLKREIDSVETDEAS